MLDLANGQLQHSIRSAKGYHGYGIDILNKPRRGWQARVYKLARSVSWPCSPLPMSTSCDDN